MLVNLVVAIQILANAIKLGAEAFLVLGLLALALWRGDVMIFLVSGLVTLFLGLGWIDDYPSIGIVMCFLSAYQLFEALRIALEAGGPARGMQQFKGLYNKVKGIF